MESSKGGKSRKKGISIILGGGRGMWNGYSRGTKSSVERMDACSKRKCRPTTREDVTWKNRELPQTLNSGCYDCFQRGVLLFAQLNRKIISSSSPVSRGRGVVFSGEDLGGTRYSICGCLLSTDVP